MLLLFYYIWQVNYHRFSSSGNIFNINVNEGKRENGIEEIQHFLKKGRGEMKLSQITSNHNLPYSKTLCADIFQPLQVGKKFSSYHKLEKYLPATEIWKIEKKAWLCLSTLPHSSEKLIEQKSFIHAANLHLFNAFYFGGRGI